MKSLQEQIERLKNCHEAVDFTGAASAHREAAT